MLESSRRIRLQDVQHPVALVGGGIGDYLVALPAVTALAGLFPNRMVLLHAAENRGFIFDGLPLKKITALKLLSSTTSPPRLDVMQTARDACPCDLFLSLAPWRWEDIAPLLRQLATAQSVGCEAACTISLAASPDMHAFDGAFRVPRALEPSLELEKSAKLPSFAGGDREAIEAISEMTRDGVRLLAVHLDTRKDKMWSPDLSADAIRRFLDAHPDFLAVLLGLDPHPLLSELHERVISWHGVPLEDRASASADFPSLLRR